MWVMNNPRMVSARGGINFEYAVRPRAASVVSDLIAGAGSGARPPANGTAEQPASSPANRAIDPSFGAIFLWHSPTIVYPGLTADQCNALTYVRASGPDTLKGDVNRGSCSRKRPRSSVGATGCAQPRNESEIGGQPEAKLAQRPGHLRLDRLDRETQPIRDLAVGEPITTAQQEDLAGAFGQGCAGLLDVPLDFPLQHLRIHGRSGIPAPLRGHSQCMLLADAAPPQIIDRPIPRRHHEQRAQRISRIHPALGVLPDGVEQVLDDVLGGIIRPHVPAHEDGEVGVMLAEHPLQPLPMCLGAGVRFPRRQHFRHMRWKSFNGLEAAARAARIYTGTRTRSKVRLG